MNYYKSGDYNITCDVCSKKIKAGQALKRWDGFIVCGNTCWEPRHPQDFVRARQDKITVPFTRPIPTLIFTDDIPTGVCTPNGVTARIDYAIIDCVIVDFISPGFIANLP